MDYLEQLSYKLFSLKVSEDGYVKADFFSRAMVTLMFHFFYVSVYFLSTKIFNKYSATYKGLKMKDKMFWSLAVVRGVFGVVATLGGIYERYFDEVLWNHVTESRSPISYLLITNHLAFFIFEVYTQIYFDILFKTFSKELHIHHTFSLSCLIHVVGYDIDHYLCNSMMILEMSTPFSCICYCLLKSNLQETKLWKANQLLMIHLFHIRSVLEWMGLYEHCKNWEHISKFPIALIISQMGGLISISFYLTPLWTYKKTCQYFYKEDWNAKKST